MTLAQLAEFTGLSPRFLSQLEAGTGNIAIGRLMLVAKAFKLPISKLLEVGEANEHRNAIDKILDRLSERELEHTFTLLNTKYPNVRARGIALIGMRGAGKSSVGALLAERLQLPFIELVDEIQSLAGLALAEIFELHGPDYYQRIARRALNKLATQSDEVILSIPGGLVNDDEAWNLVRQKYTSFFLNASPSNLIDRVAKQGDQRPMASSKDALADLKKLIAGRQLAFNQVEHSIETDQLTVDQVEEQIAACLAELGWEGLQAGGV